MAHYALFPGDLALSHNGSLTLPATRTSNATTSLPSVAAAQPYRIPRRHPRERDSFTIFLDVLIAMYKSRLPTQRTEARRIARTFWNGLPREEQLFYETLARQEREDYERDDAAPALQHRVSARDSGLRSSRGRQMVSSRSVVDRDLSHWPAAQVDSQAFVNRAPTITPTVAPGIPRVQYPNSFMMNVNTDLVAHHVYTTEGQAMIDLQHGQATQGMPTSHQWPASTSIPTAVTETSISDSQIHNSVSYYHDASGQSFGIMNQTAIPQHLPSAPVVAPVAHRPNPVTVLFTHHQLDGNIYNHNNGWGEPSTSHASTSSSVEVGSSAYYEHPAENTWDDSRDRQHQLWSSGYSGQLS
ncbi:hypothetical protein ARMGADRAFT_1033149 [Armillaria gallica]|uniref:HMG box domain-containing protein n=1 Tax=Armillaria gallica TaxID=47427 RepID=A0A2H3D778_ARMGA|nr:hypothetical protein ARMGADRAFT_1033149 [Armillaria gallica]